MDNLNYMVEQPGEIESERVQPAVHLISGLPLTSSRRL